MLRGTIYRHGPHLADPGLGFQKRTDLGLISSDTQFYSCGHYELRSVGLPCWSCRPCFLGGRSPSYFGIIVDDTIHFLSKYLKARREGLLAPEAVRSAFHTVGHELLGTHELPILSAGFLVFATSGFEVSWALGLLVTMTILFALAADFLLLPTLLIAIDRRNS